MARSPLPQSGVISFGGENLARGPAPYPRTPPGVTSWFFPPPTHTNGDELTASSASVETKSWVWGVGGRGGSGRGDCSGCEFKSGIWLYSYYREVRLGHLFILALLD